MKSRPEHLAKTAGILQAIGAEGVIPAECKAVVKQYVPEIMKAIVTLPADEVSPCRPDCLHC